MDFILQNRNAFKHRDFVCVYVVVMQNPTGFVSIDTFDSSIPSSATQKLLVETDTEPVDHHTTLLEKLLEQDLILDHPQYARTLKLVVLTPDDFESSYYNYTHPVAVGSYQLDPQTKIGSIGHIYVSDPFTGNGIGTQLKKHINNHLRQDGCVEAFTYIGSEEGRSLAKRTGYTPTDIFPQTEDILSNRFI